ncbi:MAG: nickel pincer cofactor biosynthesis protein LarB [Elusimicrobiota bacterium]
MKKSYTHARPDYARHQRQGFPEAIYCPGKTVEQIIDITSRMYHKLGSEPILLTRAEESVISAVKTVFPALVYNKYAKMGVLFPKKKVNHKKSKTLTSSYVAVVTAGTADIPIAEEVVTVLDSLGNKVKRLYDVGVAGIHRLLENQSVLRHPSCVVVCAGMEGALPSVVGGLVNCPVIAVPTSVGYGTGFNGITALLSMLNSCAANVTVVNIDDGYGAGIVAHLINRRCK